MLEILAYLETADYSIREGIVFKVGVIITTTITIFSVTSTTPRWRS